MSEEKPRCTVTGEEPTNPENASVPTNDKREDGQYTNHWTMCPGEILENGFVRPIRYWYTHLKCGRNTSMPRLVAETYASEPSYYSSTFCCTCRGYFPVGEFVWKDTNDKVGS